MFIKINGNRISGIPSMTFSRSAVGRQSVCTTMSCSSLYANGVVHRNSKSKWEMFPKSKHGSTPGERKEQNKRQKS